MRRRLIPPPNPPIQLSGGREDGSREGRQQYKRRVMYERYKAVPLPLHLHLPEVFTASLARIPPFSFP